MYVVSVTPRNVPLRNVTARQLSNVLQWNLPIVDMLEVVIILYIVQREVHSMEDFHITCTHLLYYLHVHILYNVHVHVC